MLEAILKYQEKDKEKYAVEKELKTNQIRKASNDARDRYNSARARLNSLDDYAKDLVSEFEALTKECEKIKQSAKSVGGVTASDDSDELTKNIENVGDVSAVLNSTERRIIDLTRRIDGVISEKDSEMNAAKVAKANFDKYKVQLEELNTESAKKIAEIDKVLKELEKQVDAKIMEKYKSKRAELFPVFVPLVGSETCGGCRMEIGLATVSKIKEKGFYECEQCRRLIYNK